MADLAHVGVEHVANMHSRFIGSRVMLEPQFASYAMPANSDYFPALDLGAVRARCLGLDASALFNCRRASEPIIDLLAVHEKWQRAAKLSVSPQYLHGVAMDAAQRFVRSLDQPYDQWVRMLPGWLQSLRAEGALVWPTYGADIYATAWAQRMSIITERLLPMLTLAQSKR